MGLKQEHQKELYDQKKHGDPYNVGDLVWLHSPVVPHGSSHKLHHPWTGPYKIVKKLSDITYRIQSFTSPGRPFQVVEALSRGYEIWRDNKFITLGTYFFSTSGDESTIAFTTDCFR